MKPSTMALGFLMAALIDGPLQEKAFAAQAPSFSIADATAAEEEGKICFPIKKHGKLNNNPSSVGFSTIAGTASATADYAPQTVTVNFAASEMLKNVCVPLINDANPEPTETFTAKLKAGTNSRLYDGTAIGTITDSDPVVPPEPPPPAPTFTAQDVTCRENIGLCVITVAKTGGNGLATQLSYGIGGGMPTATVGLDYTDVSGSLIIPSDASGFTFNVPILNDTLVEGNETFGTHITIISNGIVGHDAQVTITDDDVPVIPPPTEITDGGYAKALTACPAWYGRAPAAGEVFRVIPHGRGIAGWPNGTRTIIALQPLTSEPDALYLFLDCVVPASAP